MGVDQNHLIKFSNFVTVVLSISPAVVRCLFILLFPILSKTVFSDWNSGKKEKRKEKENFPITETYKNHVSFIFKCRCRCIARCSCKPFGTRILSTNNLYLPKRHHSLLLAILSPQYQSGYLEEFESRVWKTLV